MKFSQKFLSIFLLLAIFFTALVPATHAQEEITQDISIPIYIFTNEQGDILAITPDTDYTAGGSSDTWGRTWTDTELANGTFRLKLDKLATNDTLHVDYLRVKVYYTTASSASTTIQYIHTDHLGGTGVVTDLNGNQTELMDYFPYGAARIDAGTVNEQRKYAGTERDTESGLDYMQARYYASDRGQFISQDPVFWEVGQTEDGKKVLQNPQLHNSYSYAGNNPIINKDPEGRLVDTIADVGFIAYDLYRLGSAYLTGGDTKGEWAALGADIAGAVIPGVTGLGMGIRAVDKAADVAKTANKLSDGSLVCRGGTCSAGSFIKGNSGALNQGKLTDVSVQSYPSTSLSDLIQSLKTPSGKPYGSVGYTTVGDVRKMGGDVIHTPTPTNPFHSSLTGITPEAASSVMKVISNPFKK